MSSFNEVRTLISMYNSEIILGLIAVNIILFICIIIQLVKSRRLQKKYYAFMKDSDGKSIEEKIVEFIKDTEKNTTAINEMEKDINNLRDKMKKSLQQVGVVRYNAFPEMGSDLSYAVAILDEHGNGVVMSSIYGREDFRAFAKPVNKCKSAYMLSEEEKKAIEYAMKN